MRNPIFQHRHYVALASVIADIGDDTTRAFVADMFANALRSTNDRFDKDRFIAAASGEPNGRDKPRR